MGKRGFAPLWILFVAISTGSAAVAAEIVEPRPGVQQLFLFAAIPNPTASVILLTGGNGRLGLTKPADNDTGNYNFLVRSRALFTAQGFNVATVDVPSDKRTPEGLGAFRLTAEHAEDLGTVAAFLRHRANVPVVLVGTSLGSVSAANAAARQKPGTYAGVALTSPGMRGGEQEPTSIKDVDVAAIRMPVLVLFHKEDGCGASLPSLVPGLVMNFTRAPVKQLAIQGGLPPQSAPCEPLSSHGFYGREKEAVEAIAGWIKATLK